MIKSEMLVNKKLSFCLLLYYPQVNVCGSRMLGALRVPIASLQTLHQFAILSIVGQEISH